MELWLEIVPWLVAMLVLIGFSGFFSASEAAFFYLRTNERRQLARGNQPQRLAAHLLEDPDRLLSAVLFWNLLVNIVYFAIVSAVGIRIERSEHGTHTTAVLFATGALLCIIFFSEMLPKSVAVLGARGISTLVAIPLAVSIRLVDPLLPLLRLVNLLSRRLLWPRFQPEQTLEVADLERAIELSTSDAQLLEQEQAALRNIVLLSDIRVDEWMRPRTQFLTFRSPVSLDDLEGEITPSGYLFLQEESSEEVVAAVNLKELVQDVRDHLEQFAQPVLFIPWCAKLSEALEQMQQRKLEVAVVVNEFGETIGVLTFEDILDTIFSYNPSRSQLLLNRKPIHDLAPDKWLVAGVTSLRRLARYLDIQMPASRNVTIAGVVQENLQRLAAAGDECEWGPLHLKVLEAPQRGHMLVEVTRIDSRGEGG